MKCGFCFNELSQPPPLLTTYNGLFNLVQWLLRNGLGWSDGRSNGRTDEALDICLVFGEYNNCRKFVSLTCRKFIYYAKAKTRSICTDILQLKFKFKHNFFTSIEKQVFTTYTNFSRFCFLGTTPVLAPNLWANGKISTLTPAPGNRTRDLKIARPTLYL